MRSIDEYLSLWLFHVCITRALNDTDRNLGSRLPRRILQSDDRGRGLGVQVQLSNWFQKLPIFFFFEKPKELLFTCSISIFTKLKMKKKLLLIKNNFLKKFSEKNIIALHFCKSFPSSRLIEEARFSYLLLIIHLVICGFG